MTETPQGFTIDLSTPPATIVGPSPTVTAADINRIAAPTTIVNAFTVTQSRRQNTSSNPLSPVTITVSASAPTTGSNPTSSSSSGLGSGTKVGIGIGAVLGALVILSVILWWWKSRKRMSARLAALERSINQQDPSSAEKGVDDKQEPHELAGKQLHEVSGEQHQEMPVASAAWEVPADSPSMSNTKEC
ncbi:MAG: hypothetical protein Q9176_003760 [Flavoplaca citrina]